MNVEFKKICCGLCVICFFTSNIYAEVIQLQSSIILFSDKTLFCKTDLLEFELYVGLADLDAIYDVIEDCTGMAPTQELLDAVYSSYMKEDSPCLVYAEVDGRAVDADILKRGKKRKVNKDERQRYPNEKGDCPPPVDKPSGTHDDCVDYPVDSRIWFVSLIAAIIFKEAMPVRIRQF